MKGLARCRLRAFLGHGTLLSGPGFHAAALKQALRFWNLRTRLGRCGGFGVAASLPPNGRHSLGIVLSRLLLRSWFRQGIIAPPVFVAGVADVGSIDSISIHICPERLAGLRVSVVHVHRICAPHASSTPWARFCRVDRGRGRPCVGCSLAPLGWSIFIPHAGRWRFHVRVHYSWHLRWQCSGTITFRLTTSTTTMNSRLRALFRTSRTC